MKFSKISILSLLAVAAVGSTKGIEGQFVFGGEGTGYPKKSYNFTCTSRSVEQISNLIIAQYFRSQSSKLVDSCDIIDPELGTKRLAYLGKIADGYGGMSTCHIQTLQRLARKKNCEFCSHVADQLENMKLNNTIDSAQGNVLVFGRKEKVVDIF